MIIGVVAEFNPFHNGHKYQIEKIDEYFKPDIKIALISGDFVQRGEISIINAKKKTEIALLNGYDIVALIPYEYSLQNAEIYCSMSCKILDALNVDVQVFGAETEDLKIIYDMNEILKKADISFYTKQGYSYNQSCKMALGDLGNFYTSNNILAMEYVKAIEKFNLKQKPFIIKREGALYNSQFSINNIASASYIRKLILEKEEYTKFIPTSLGDNFNINYEDMLFELFKYIFKTRDCKNIYDMNEDIYNMINSNINYRNYNEFLKSINYKNISINRIKRIILNTVLNISNDDINKNIKIESVNILGLNKKGAKYIKNMKCADVKSYKSNNSTDLLKFLNLDYKFNNLIYEE